MLNPLRQGCKRILNEASRSQHEPRVKLGFNE